MAMLLPAVTATIIMSMGYKKQLQETIDKK
jgi:hypothetical protein